MQKSQNEEYDSSWDLEESSEGNLPQNADTFEKKFAEWEKRDWFKWLNDNLTFPFQVKRMEDDYDAYFTDIAKYEPFRLGHIIKVLSIENEDSLYGIIVKVREKRRIVYIPLCDVEVTSKEDENYWPVREYIVWFANR
ncbi:MAG: hypothetical protein HQ591_10280 [candidate division Zixibacteria bacterium]|nr:hypothetical protein [Candidatus Tariuqbacter arcticus]